MTNVHFSEIRRLINNGIYIGAATYAAEQITDELNLSDERREAFRMIIESAMRSGNLYVAQDIRDSYEMDMNHLDVWSFDRFMSEFMPLEEDMLQLDKLLSQATA